MNFDEPIHLKAEDSPSVDPQALGIQLMAVLRRLATDATDVRDTLAHWGEDPISAHRRAQSRAVELSDAASQARELGEQLLRELRMKRLFSASYGAERGGRDGR